MMTVHKFEVPIESAQMLSIPGDHWEAVYAANDWPGAISLWLLHDSDQPAQDWVFRVVETGHPIDDGWAFVRSVPVGNRVVHVTVRPPS